MANTNPLKDNPNIIPVPAIVSFSKEGKLLPLYISYEGEKLRLFNQVKIKENLHQYSYTADVESNGQIKQIIITYMENMHTWVLHIHE